MLRMMMMMNQLLLQHQRMHVRWQLQMWHSRHQSSTLESFLGTVCPANPNWTGRCKANVCWYPLKLTKKRKPKGAKQLKRAAPLALEDQKVDKKETAKKATAVKAKASKPEVSGGSSQQGNSTTKPMALENQPTPGQASKSTLPPAKLERCKSNVSNDGNGVASAVDACLNRQDTANLNKTGKGIAKAAAAADPDPSEPDSSSSENESENGENPQDEQDLEKVLKQKESRARYMRFYRSLRSTLDLLSNPAKLVLCLKSWFTIGFLLCISLGSTGVLHI